MRFVQVVTSGGSVTRANPACVARVESVLTGSGPKTRLHFPDGDTLHTEEEVDALVARLERAMKPEPMVFG